MNNSPSHYPPDDAALEESKMKAMQQSISRLQADHAEQSAQRRARQAEDARIQDRFRDLMFGHLRSKETELKQLAEDQRRLIEGRPKLARRPLLAKRLPMERSPATHTLAIPGPPYDFAWKAGGQGTETASTDGSIDLSTQAFGDRSVAAGVGIYFPASGGGVRRFGTRISFSYEWTETAQLYVGRNEGRVWLSVWGITEGDWVVTSGDQFLSWSDHVGWYQSHHDNREGQASHELVFNALPDSWYSCVLNASLHCYADNGAFGFAISQASLHIALESVYVT
jgi:hypothetical protein